MPLVQDLRFGCRALRRNPAFALTAIATLALGIAVNTTIFSVVNGVLLRPLPYRDADRLALLWTTNPLQNAFERATGLLNVQGWRAARSFEAMAWFRDEPVVLREEPEPEPMDAVFVSPDFFGMVGARLALGRFFTSEEAERGDCLAVLSYGLWQRRFGGSREVLGRVLQIETRRATVVGVLPADFRPLARPTQVWMPDTSASFYKEIRTSRGSKFGWNVIAQLRPGVTLAQAQAEMNGIAAQLAAAWPKTNRDSGVRVISLLDQVTQHIRLALMLMQVAVGLVLLIACMNLGNLMMARAAGREREMAVRGSLGASRWQLVRQLLTESALLSAMAAGVGFGLAAIGLKTLLALAPASVPRLNEISLDWRALAFTMGCSLGGAVLFGLAPALRLSGTAMVPTQRSAGGARATRRFRNVLVTAEYAVAIVMLTGTGLLVRSLAAVLRVDPGFNSSGVLTVELHSPAGNDPLDPPRFQELFQALEAIPGVEAAGGISRYFQANVQVGGGVSIAGRPPVDPSNQAPVNYDVIAGEYLKAIGVPLLRGRYFGPQDGPNAPDVAIVNAAFLHAFLPDGDPIGQMFRRAGDPTSYTIVGVFGDMRRQEITREPIPEVLWPQTQRPWGMSLAVRTFGDPMAMAGAVRSTISRVNRGAVVTSVSTLDRKMDERIAQRRFQTWLLGLFAGLAVVLAAIGIYGLMHYSVSERRQEIGVRIALGARPLDVFGLVLKEAARLAAAGMAVGMATALWLTRLVASMLYGVSAHDPATYAGALLLLGVAALAASAVPARRAVACDPLPALRGE
ncbi:MAG TPA: ABC transporter permease [Bryobacteraceae bacterium]|nr:ABC transporter permease [Bryobacteraceae bacterium]